jgi:hypothetical protein
MKLDEFFVLSLSLECWALFFLALAAYYHAAGLRQRSVCCVMTVGILGLLASLLPFLPNYVGVLALEEYYVGCAPNFDAFIGLIISILFGSCFSALLGWMVFSHLFSLPISLVRGLWLLLLEPEDTGDEWQVNPSLLGILCTLMRYQACITPLITIFPLLFAFQLVEDNESWWYLFAFWLLPQLWILAQSSVQQQGWELTVFAYRSVHFYGVWVLIYVACFLLFLNRQFSILNMSLVNYLWESDWPLAWSWMHMDFCIMNVLITDVIGMILGENKRLVTNPSAPADRPAPASHISVQIPNCVIEVNSRVNVPEATEKFGASSGHLLLEFPSTNEVDVALLSTDGSGLQRLSNVLESRQPWLGE